jgi:hypothetical protein
MSYPAPQAYPNKKSLLWGIFLYAFLMNASRLVLTLMLSFSALFALWIWLFGWTSAIELPALLLYRFIVVLQKLKLFIELFST